MTLNNPSAAGADEPGSTGVLRPLREFLATETAGAALLLLGAVVAMIWANSPWEASYHHLWETQLGVSLGAHHFSLDLQGWVNDGLMSLFFLVVGLEIKRELVEGELASFRRAALPAVAALGGMVVPAVIYFAINAGTPDAHAWGIPMATDIALAMGVLTVLGSRIAPSAKIFLLALAIADDLGAIAVIAIVYSHGLRPTYLLGVAGCIASVLVLRRALPGFTIGFVALGLIMWWCTYEAGIHATIAGVIMALLTPIAPLVAPGSRPTETLADVTDLGMVRGLVARARSSISRVEWLEHGLHPWTSLLIVPIFALANAGITLDRTVISGIGSSKVVWGIILGLVVGKPLGISAAVWLGRTFGLTLPDGLTMADVATLGAIAGIGFTVSIFVADLAITNTAISDEAQLAVLIASVVAAAIGATLATIRASKRTAPPAVGA